MKKITYRLSALPLLLALLHCASQSPPSGGPVDETPPEVVASSPVRGGVGVDHRAAVTITFSEWINRSGAAGAVSVYPPLARGADVKVAKKKLVITPREPLEGNTTYLVTVGTALKDLRGNAMPHPVNIAFSTGAELDSGRLEGSIVGLEPRAKAKRVMLFAEGDGGDGRDGVEARDGGDGKDGKDGKEGGGDGGWDDARYFQQPRYAALCDTAGVFSFSHLRAGAYRVVAFADEYKTGRMRVGDSCFTSLQKSVGVTNARQFIRLYPADSDTATAKDSAVADTAAGGVDTAKAGGVDTAKAGGIDTAKAGGVDTAKAVAIDTSKAGAIDTASAKRATNICYRLQGGADCLEPNEKRMWTYTPIGAREAQTFTVPDSAGNFAFDSIPASKGTLMWFIDDNDDGKPTRGKLIPWRAPERFFAVPDTIEAKAGWEIEGVRVKGCEE